MKVGILTFIHTKNFGANLQCFALQHKLLSMGYDAEVINLYRPKDKGYIPCKEDNERFSPIFTYKSLKDYKSKFNKFAARLISSLKYALSSKKQDQESTNGFDHFQQKYIKFSENCYRNFTQLYNEFPHQLYSHLVVGSDQVWNYSSDFSKEPFFLTFTDSPKKISYAASVGHDSIPEKIAPLLRKWLESFSAISVREKTSVSVVEKLTNKDIDSVIDPTLLITKDQWLQAFSIKKESNQTFVLVYMLSVSESTLKLATDIANKIGCGVKIITNRPLLTTPSGCEVLRNENPKSFVELYCKASFVVTNSFHGTAFAINFNIPFVTMDKQSARLNIRKGDLLKLLHLENRNLFEGDSYDIDNIMSCDFTEANNILESERKKADLFIKKNIY